MQLPLRVAGSTGTRKALANAYVCMLRTSPPESERSVHLLVSVLVSVGACSQASLLKLGCRICCSPCCWCQQLMTL